MSNKKIVIIISIFIVGFLAIAGLIGISNLIPILRKPLMLIFSIILIIFVLAFFTFAIKRRK